MVGSDIEYITVFSNYRILLDNMFSVICRNTANNNQIYRISRHCSSMPISGSKMSIKRNEGQYQSPIEFREKKKLPKQCEPNPCSNYSWCRRALQKRLLEGAETNLEDGGEIRLWWGLSAMRWAMSTWTCCWVSIPGRFKRLLRRKRISNPGFKSGTRG